MAFSKKELKTQLAQYQTNLKHQLGQHYLVSTKAIFTLLHHLEKTEEIVEIGPGVGNITIEYIHNFSHVLLIEIDKEKVPILEENLAHANGGTFPSWVTIVSEDILSVNLDHYISPMTNYQIIGALPYNISKRIVGKCLRLTPPPTQCIFLMQREVVDAYTASPPNNTLLSVTTEFFAHAEKKEVIPPEAFHPKPKVMSRILRIHNFVRNEKEIDMDAFLTFVQKGFSYKRKKLSHFLKAPNMSMYTDKFEPSQNVLYLLNKRAQELSEQEWIFLYESIFSSN